MNINVIKFFEKYDADPELQKRVADAVNAYPGSLELREALAKCLILHCHDPRILTSVTCGSPCAGLQNGLQFFVCNLFGLKAPDASTLSDSF